MMECADVGGQSTVSFPEFKRGSHWDAMVVRVGGFSNISVIPEPLWSKLDAMERALSERKLRKVCEPVCNLSYVSVIGGRPMRVTYFAKKGTRFDVFLIDTTEIHTVQELFELPDDFDLDIIPSFARRVSLCSEHIFSKMEFPHFKTLLETKHALVHIFVTKCGDSEPSQNTPEVLFVNELCEDLMDKYGLSGAPRPGHLFGTP
ncbi:uncharacterized protein LOC100898564 [Galendromus occidentalis]|uniref:Uncharacterized protein LOC100898564 n=1 Tax=Galendromus occidentalis TaxID=34638 RepID=A0AAJ6VYI6_9ACAR|nr:uncharacterized protein LOC100898564 [Galendromus occidentalis]